MFLKEIYLKNYKCFEEKTFSFKERFTVLIGENGSGKTSLLDGIARGLMPLVSGFHMVIDGLFMTQNEVRILSKKRGSKSTLEVISPYIVKTNVQYNNKDYSWRQEGKMDSDMNSGGAMMLVEKLRHDDNAILPIFAYYHTSRHWSTKKYLNVELYPISSRYKVYEDCLNPSTSSKAILEWFKRMEIIRFQKQIFPPELKAVQEAIEKALEGLKKNKKGIPKAYFSAENDELMIDIGDGKEFPFRLLSEGYRNTLGLIADIAYRMAELNPHVTIDTPGVVLIDEIDLHLHPKWQRNIVGDLKRIFPNCQFIVTTHSPFIIQSLKAEELIRLDGEMDNEKDPFRESVEEVVENYMGIDEVERSEQFKEMERAAAEYYAIIAEGQQQKSSKELKGLKKKLDKLELQYSDDPAYVALMKAERNSQPIKL